MLVNQHRQAQPNLPPTTLILGKENKSHTRTDSGQGSRQAPSIPQSNT